MERSRFLKNMLGVGFLSVWSCQSDDHPSENGARNSKDKYAPIKSLRQELTAAWLRSEELTLANVEQMPPEEFTFKYTEEAMSFAEQWRHCVIYTCGQIAGRTDIANPYKDIKLPVQMSKENVIKELKNMYAFVRKSIEDLSDDELFGDCDFAGDTIPIWRLFYALENHIIHHRGQCIVYLRLKGVTPKGYYGW